MRYYINVYHTHYGFAWASKAEAENAANLANRDDSELLYRIHVRLK